MAKKKSKKTKKRTQGISENRKPETRNGQPTSGNGQPFYRQWKLQAAALFVLAFLLYANTIGHDFALDDAIVITDNEVVKRGVAGFGDLFRYRPLTPAMFALERQLSEEAFLHHLLNALWYGFLIVIIFLFVRDLAHTDKRAPWWFAVAVAALFAAHPLHTEAVANIKGRDEIIALLGAVGGTWWIFRSAERDNILGAAAGAMMVFLGCLAKENALTFLAVIPAVLLLFGKRGSSNGRLKYFLPALGAVALFLLIRSSVIGLSLGEPVRELMNNPYLELKNGVWVDMSTSNRLATVMHTLWEYLRLLFVPTGLVHDYYPMAVPMKSWSQLTPWLGLLLHTGLGIFALLKFRTHRFMALGILIYLASLSIVSNVFFSVGTNMSERFLFMPSFGWAIAVAGLLALLTRKFGSTLAWMIPVIVLVFGALTISRNPVWKDNFTLFTTDVLKQPNSAKLLNAAGGVRVDTYQKLRSEQQSANQQLLTAAQADLTRAINIHPTYKNAYLLRGNANLLLKNYDAAITDYDQALTLDGGYAAATENLVVALTAAGQDAGEAKGDLQSAFRYLRRAEQLAPNDYETLRLLGVASGVSGRLDQALDYFRRAAESRPNDAEARWNYGIALYNGGNTQAAEVEFQAAERIKPGIRREKAGN